MFKWFIFLNLSNDLNISLILFTIDYLTNNLIDSQV